MKCFFVFLFFVSSNLFGQDTLVATQFEMNSCVSLFYSGSHKVIKTKEELNAAIRKDGSAKRCQKDLGSFDIDQFSLFGININSGYCGAPLGLKFRLIQIDNEKKYIVQISYAKPMGQCRALSSYDLWIQTPTLLENYKVEYTITPLPYPE